MWLGPESPLVRIQIGLDADAVLRRVRADGHAGSMAAGTNTVCAAVTVLLRSVHDSLSRYPGVELRAWAPEPGELGYCLESYPAALAVPLRAVSGVLLTGLAGLERDYPGMIQLKIQTEGGNNGT